MDWKVQRLKSPKIFGCKIPSFGFLSGSIATKETTETLFFARNSALWNDSSPVSIWRVPIIPFLLPLL